MGTGLRPTVATAFFASVALLLVLVFTAAKSAVQPKPLYAMDTSNNTLVASAGCTNATLNGTYGVKLGGFFAHAPHPGLPSIGAFFPAASVGAITYDGNGNFSFSGTASVSGFVFEETHSGTYTVNSDCSGSLTNTTGQTFNIEIVDGGLQVKVIATFPGVVLTGEQWKQ
jgi:hypothetical protein